MIAHLCLRIVVLFIFSLFSALAAIAAPAISKISPTVGPVSPVGSKITITGTGFGLTQGDSSVTVGGVSSVPTSWSDTKIVAPVPSSLMPGFADVIVTASGTPSNAQPFLVIPVITAVSPAHVSVGGSVTVTGTSFGDTQGTSTVTFNGLSATSSVWASTSITFAIPSGATTGTILVTVNGWATNGVYYYIAPSINGLSSASGPIGSILTINGSGFGTAQNFNPVTIGGVSVTPSSWSDTVITVPIPANVPAGSASVVVTVNTLASNAASFAITPAITGLSVNSGTIGDSITITGTSFGAAQGANTITFNGLLATPSSWSDTSIAVPVPSGATTGPVIVMINGVASNAVTFTVLQAVPVITGVSPNPAGGCGNTTITGSGFGSTAGVINLAGHWLNLASGWVVNWTDSAIVLFTPDFLGQGSFPIYVSTSDAHTSNTVQLAINPALYISPGQLNLLVGGTQNLQVLDATGATQSTVQWSVADPSVASITLPVNAGDPTVLRANAEGVTTITASAGGLTAQATVTVLPGASLPFGVSPWSAPPLSCSGGGIRNIIQSVRADDDTPDFYVWDSSGASSIRAYDSSGQQKWIWPAPGASPAYPYPIAADNAGGVLAYAFDNANNQYLTRVDKKGNQSWTHPTNAFSNMYAVGPDGTVYLVEDSLDQPPQLTQVVAIDGNTGQPKFSITLPLSQAGTINASVGQGTLLCTPGMNSLTGTSDNTVGPAQSGHGTLSISSDGVVYLPVLVQTRVFDGLPCDPGPNVPKSYYPLDTTTSTLTYSATLELMEIQPDGAYTLVPLDSTVYSGTNWNTPVSQFDGYSRAIPDGHGSALYASQNSTGPIYGNQGIITHEALIYRDTGGSFPNPTGGGGIWGYDPILIGENNIGFAANFLNNGTVAAFDLTTGAPKYIFQSTQAAVRLNMVASDGSLFIEEGNFGGTNYLTKLDPAGNPSPVFPGNPSVFSPTYLALGHWGGSVLGNFVLPQGNFAPVAVSERPRNDGNAGKQTAAPLPVIVDFLPSHIENPNSPSTSQYTVLSFRSDMLASVPDPFYGQRFDSSKPPATQRFYLRGSDIGGFTTSDGRFIGPAEVEEFLGEVGRPAGAVAFIGHDSDCCYGLGPSSHFSIGINFYYPNSLGLAPDLQPEPDPFGSENRLQPLEKDAKTWDKGSATFTYNNTTGIVHQDQVVATTIDKIATEARVIFLGACDLNPTFFASMNAVPPFMQLWDISANTQGKALVVPNTAHTDLAISAQFWIQLVKRLVSQDPETIGQAVHETNQWLQSQGPVIDPSTGLPIPIPVWQVVGDSCVQIKPGKSQVQPPCPME